MMTWNLSSSSTSAVSGTAVRLGMCCSPPTISGLVRAAEIDAAHGLDGAVVDAHQHHIGDVDLCLIVTPVGQGVGDMVQEARDSLLLVVSERPRLRAALTLADDDL